ncbi:MAG: FxDxF family PEP-CTERM protein [Ferribacterium limneticum]
MNSIKKAICIAAIAASAGAQASAPIFEAEANDTIGTAQSLGFLVSGTELNIYGLRFDPLPGGSSLDFYSFSTASALNITLSVTTQTGASFGSDPMVGLYNSAGTRIAENDDYNGWDSLLTHTVSAGTYYVAVTGYAEAADGTLDFSDNPNSDRNWSYALNVSAAPIPEPESYAMFLAGLGIIGAVARRSKTT